MIKVLGAVVFDGLDFDIINLIPKSGNASLQLRSKLMYNVADSECKGVESLEGISDKFKNLYEKKYLFLSSGVFDEKSAKDFYEEFSNPENLASYF